MDHSNGTQSSVSLLPSVETLEPGLILLFKHPNVDRRYILQHIEDLSKEPLLAQCYPSFQERDLSKGPLDEMLSTLDAKSFLIRNSTTVKNSTVNA